MGGRALRPVTCSRGRAGSEASFSNCHDRRPAGVFSESCVTTIPLVFMVGQDPVKSGLVTSLSRPGGNATGVNLLIVETESKRVDLLRELAPTASVSAAFINPKSTYAQMQSSAVTSAAHSIGQQIEMPATNSILKMPSSGSYRKKLARS